MIQAKNVFLFLKPKFVYEKNEETRVNDLELPRFHVL